MGIALGAVTVAVLGAVDGARSRAVAEGGDHRGWVLVSLMIVSVALVGVTRDRQRVVSLSAVITVVVLASLALLGNPEVDPTDTAPGLVLARGALTGITHGAVLACVVLGATRPANRRSARGQINGSADVDEVPANSGPEQSDG
jgi:hypothetical protein